MFHRLEELANGILGLSLQSHELHLSHMAVRSLIVFCFAVLLVRFGNRRLLGRSAGFDIMVAIILGSVLSRAINGQAAFFPTLGASAFLVFLHHVMATFAFHSHAFSRLVKGDPRVLVRNGKIDRAALQRSKITDDDLDENLRLTGNLEGTAKVAEARLERSGSVSAVKSGDDEK
jgi:uncharacterized membrane protein YcaP (DUF421 family)